MADAPKIRSIMFERDTDTDERSVLDIREFDIPAESDNSSWTALARDSGALKRALLLDLAKQLDQLIAGDVDSIELFRHG